MAQFGVDPSGQSPPIIEHEVAGTVPAERKLFKIYGAAALAQVDPGIPLLTVVRLYDLHASGLARLGVVGDSAFWRIADYVERVDITGASWEVAHLSRRIDANPPPGLPPVFGTLP
ncbi:MAG: hypothetical protein AAFZ65_04035 [Planctomycetota bacterium]